MSTSAATARGTRRSSAPTVRATAAPLEFGRERFRFTLHREQRRLNPLAIDAFVEHVSWTRDSAVRTGELNFRRPLTGLQAAAIATGDRILVEVDLHGDGRWNRLWYMAVATPTHQIASGIISMALNAQLKVAQHSKVSWNFKNKTARQITLLVAKRFHIAVGALPASGHRIKKLARKSASPLDMVTAAWRAERDATGRRFDIDVSRGQLDVVELREPKYRLLLEKAVIDATLTESLERMVSAVVVTSTRTVSGRKHKLTVKVVDDARVKRYGYIVRHVNEPNLKTTSACRKFGKTWLAKHAKPVSDITFTHVGIPYLDKGDAIRLTIKEGNVVNLLCFVKATTHDVSAGSYTMEVTVGISDPWVDVRAERAKKKRDLAAAKRRRESRSHAKPPKAAKAARRS